MKTLTRHLLSTRALAVAGATALLAAATPAHAILITANQTLPNLSPNNNQFHTPSAGNDPINLYTATDGLASDSVNQVDLGVFTFTGYDSSLTSLVGLQVALNLDTFNTNPGAQNNNNEFLTIDGVNTGIALNNFGPSYSQHTATGTVSDPTAADTILGYLNGTGGTYTSSTLVYNVDPTTGNFTSAAAENDNDGTNASGDFVTLANPTFASFQAGAGQLVIGVLNTSPITDLSQQDVGFTQQTPEEFSLAGGSASLEVSDAAIPFHPAQALGFALIALCIGLWYLPQTRDHFRRMLVPVA